VGNGVGEGVLVGNNSVAVTGGLEVGVSRDDVIVSGAFPAHETRSKITRLQKIIFIRTSDSNKDYNSTSFCRKIPLQLREKIHRVSMIHVK